MTDKQLHKTLQDHRDWVARPSGPGKRADLRAADLRNMKLCGVDLRWADLRAADLSGADLTDANLQHADLRGANLSNAVCHRTCFVNANLQGARMDGADMRGADLQHADASGGAIGAFKQWVRDEHSGANRGKQPDPAKQQENQHERDGRGR